MFEYRKTSDGQKFLVERDIVAASMKFLKTVYIIGISGESARFSI
jgi:hypothetical protein